MFMYSKRAVKINFNRPYIFVIIDLQTDYTKVDIKSIARAQVLDLPYKIKDPNLPSTEMEVRWCLYQLTCCQLVRGGAQGAVT